MEKRNWDPKSGSGWMKDPKDGLWYKYKNFEKTGKSQKTVVHRNPLVAISYNTKKFQKWNEEQIAERLKIEKAKRDAGYYKDGRGKWKKSKNYNQKQVELNKEITENNLKVNSNEEVVVDNDSTFFEQPIGTNLGIGNYLDLMNLDIDYSFPENQLKVDKPVVDTDKKMSKIEKENRRIFGDAHVDMLKIKNKEFQAIKKIKDKKERKKAREAYREKYGK